MIVPILLTIVVSASVPALYQDFAAQHCVQGNPVCFEITDDPIPGKVDAQALDLTTGQFMRTYWINPNAMVREITQAGNTECVVMHEEEGELVETPCIEMLM